MLLSLDQVSVQYQKVVALKGISMSVPEGGIVTIIGANGAGKSTVRTTSVEARLCLRPALHSTDSLF